MIKEINTTLTPKEASSKEAIKSIASKSLSIDISSINTIQIIKKSIDSRGRFPKVNIKIRVYINEEPKYKYENTFNYQNVENKPSVIVIGSGPAGLFAALRLIEKGLCPIVLERGKEVLPRKQDIALLNRNQSLNPESNYCFGEGGAGTFSDGKLYTRSKKRGNTQRIFEIFHNHGAQDEILFEAHPHIGTDKLPEVIKNICDTIRQCGGSVHFETKVTELIIQESKIEGVITENGDSYIAPHVILATGHSARDIYHLLHKQNIKIEAKGFAMGVRVEHPQSIIDSIQYHCKERSQYLPAASYNLVTQVNNRGVYSFCMCPGGHIVPSSTEEGQLVVNGMSASKRNSNYANSGIVVEIQPEDLTEYTEYGELCGLKFQEDFEHLCYVNNGGLMQKAPAQRLEDFVKGHLSYDLPESSYLPGLIASPLHFWMPERIAKRLQQGFKDFNRKMKGFVTNDAIVVGVESRSSSPIRIPRDKETMQHIQISGLYPCGEGSGYAGGITSSAMDGENAANQIAQLYNE